MCAQSEPGLIELVWSDPAQTDLEEGYVHNDTRGCAVVFGANKVRCASSVDARGRASRHRAWCLGALWRCCVQVDEFRRVNSIDLIIRSHEPVAAGFEWFDSGHLVTVFSATNYTGCVPRACIVPLCDAASAAVVGYVQRAIQLWRVPLDRQHPQGGAAHDSPGV
jgi:hypothetical protein